MTTANKQFVEEDIAWSKKLYPLVINTIAPLTILEASPYLDSFEATDLIVKPGSIGVRCRRPGTLNPDNKKSRYNTQWTFMFRSWRKSGSETELSKIMRGKSSRAFYGFVARDEQSFDAWWFLDLDVFRSAYAANPILGTTASFYRGEVEAKWFDVRQFPSNLVIGSHRPSWRR